MDHVDCVVVGAGVVGLAITRALSHAGIQVLLIEKGADLGAGTSGRGSGVIHAGLHDPPDSLKARLCREGRHALYAFAADHGVPHRRWGKLLVATSEAEAGTLQGISARAAANGVADLVPLSGVEARALEPALACAAALLSPSTGVIDAHALLRALRDDAEEFGAVTAFQAPLVAARREKLGFTLDIVGATPMQLRCRLLINAAGHGAPAVARAIEGLRATVIPRPFFAKGNYFTLDRPTPFQRLIYPMPVPGGLGIHLTLDVEGRARFGPDVEWVDQVDDTVDPARAAHFHADVRRWWPSLPAGALIPARAGVRPKITGPGEPARDSSSRGRRRTALPASSISSGSSRPTPTHRR